MKKSACVHVCVCETENHSQSNSSVFKKPRNQKKKKQEQFFSIAAIPSTPNQFLLCVVAFIPVQCVSLADTQRERMRAILLVCLVFVSLLYVPYLLLLNNNNTLLLLVPHPDECDDDDDFVERAQREL